jgi:Beta propeller domain
MYIVVTRASFEASTIYAMDMSDPKDPVITGELALSGSPSYLIAAGENIIVAVGRFFVGYNPYTAHVTLQLTSIDVSLLFNPRLVDHWEDVPRNVPAMTQLTTTLSEHRAFLYDIDFKVLIVPTGTILYPCNSTDECFEPGPVEFDGFRVFKLFAIDHSSVKFICDLANKVKIGRAFVFKGDVTTMKGNTVLSHDLLTKSEDATAVTLSADC